MLHASPRASDARRTTSLRPLTMLATALATLMLGSASTCVEPPKPAACEAACDLEVECGFRGLSACEAASCNPVMGSILYADVDACLRSADDCLEAAACVCDEGCGKTDECVGSPDSQCVSTCDTLVEQQPKATYLENFCRIESSCSDLAACGAVSG